MDGQGMMLDAASRSAFGGMDFASLMKQQMERVMKQMLESFMPGAEAAHVEERKAPEPVEERKAPEPVEERKAPMAKSQPEPIHVPEQIPVVPETDPVQEPDHELEPEPLQLGPSYPHFKPVEPLPLFERVREPAPYASAARLAPKRARSDSDGEDNKHMDAVGPVSKKPSNHFNTFRRASVGAESCANAFAPKRCFDNLPPVVELTQEQCEDCIEEVGERFRISLAKQDIKKRLTERGTAEIRKADHKFAIQQIDHESAVTDDVMEILIWANQLRAIATMTSTKQAAKTSPKARR